jgi:hypothetical protein
MPLIPEISLEDLLCCKEDEIRNMPSSVILDEDGYYLATLIVPQTDFIKMQTEYLGELSNGVKPKE